LYANIFCSSIDNLKCTPSDRQMYPWEYMYPRLGTPELSQARDVTLGTPKRIFCKMNFFKKQTAIVGSTLLQRWAFNYKSTSK